MSKAADRSPSQAEVEAYRRDGAVCLRGAFAEWVEALRRGVERNIAEPGPTALDHRVEAGRFFEDYCNWQRIPEYRDYVLRSPAAAIAGRLMAADRVQIFHEHVLVKEPGTAKPTPWHHDMPYYCLQGSQTVSFWLALDPVPRAICPQFVAGSHLWGALYHPRRFDDGGSYDRYAGFDPVPEVETLDPPPRILSWDLEPGDALAFHFLTLHGAPGNEGTARRRGFSTRWIGDDVRFAERPGITSPPYPGIGLRHGDPLREDWFPVVWRAAAPPATR